MNRCADIEKRLSAYLDGDVAPQEQELIEEHLAMCKQCSKALENIKKTTELVRNLEEIEPPPWLKHKIMAHVREEAEKRTGIFRKLFFPLHIKIPMEVFATCLVVVMAIYVFKATGPEIRSLQAPSGQTQAPSGQTQTPSEQTQTTDYPDKQNRKTVILSTPVSKEKAALREHYEKNKVVSSQPMKETADIIIPREVQPAPKLPVPGLSAPLQSVPAGSVKERETGLKSKALQSAPLSAGVPEPAHKKKGDIAATDSGGKYQLGRNPASNEMQLKASAVGKQQTIIMTVKADKVISVGSEIKDMLKSFGAADIKQISQENIEILTAVFPAQKLKELYEKLKTIGEVKENVLIYNIPEQEVTVRIEIVNISKKP
ncbi:MAG: DUF2275 domain-containing protein [Proteobacteria bacterium]|nr:DUF2275 domain-containing protein [Pseudomonadota bacterium]